MMLQFASKLIMYWNFNWIWRHLILTIYWQYIFLLHKNKNSGRNRKVDYDVVFCCPYKHSKVTNLNYFKNEKYDILPINIGKYICVFCDTYFSKLSIFIHSRSRSFLLLIFSFLWWKVQRFLKGYTLGLNST